MSESGAWTPFTIENQALKGEWRRRRARDISPLVESAYAEAGVLWLLFAHTVNRFAKRLGVNPFCMNGQHYASATHALVLFLKGLPSLGAPVPSEMESEFGRTVIAAQAECLKLEQEDELRLERRASQLLVAVQVDVRSSTDHGDVRRLAAAVEKNVGEIAEGREEVAAIKEQVKELEQSAEQVPALATQVRELADRAPPKPPVPVDADALAKVALLMNHRPTNIKAAAQVLEMSRNTVRGAMKAASFVLDPDCGKDAWRPSGKTVDDLARRFDMASVPPWCEEAIRTLNERKDGRRKRSAKVVYRGP